MVRLLKSILMRLSGPLDTRAETPVGIGRGTAGYAKSACLEMVLYAGMKGSHSQPYSGGVS